MGIAAVLAIWFATHPPRRAADQNSPEILIAQAPKSESAPSLETRSKQQSAESTATPGKNNEADAKALKGMPAGRVQSANPSTDSLAKKNPDGGNVAREIAPSSNAPENNLRDEKKEKSEFNTYQSSGAVAGLSAPAPAARAAAAPPPVPAPQAQAKVQSTTEAPPITPAPPSVSQSAQVTEAAPQVQTANRALSGSLNESTAKDLPLNGRNYESLLKLDAAGEFPAQINSPSGKIVLQRTLLRRHSALH